MTTIAFLPNGAEVEMHDLTQCRRCGGYAVVHMHECERPRRECHKCPDWEPGLLYPCQEKRGTCAICNFVQHIDTQPVQGTIVIEEL